MMGASTTASARKSLAIALLLTAATIAVYAPVLRHDFISYDDPDYVTSNPQVKAGLTPGGILWAFGTWRTGNWHPLTWLSHMGDVSLFGMSPAGHHATSLALHALNAVLLFGFLQRATGSRARSAFVAGLFALHPLHVESVAWIAERKDVLSAAFGLGALWAWTAHVTTGAGEVPPRGSRSGLSYAAALALFSLGLLAKPMLVTLPFVMLLLDFWPFGRIGGIGGIGREAAGSAGGSRGGSLATLVREKAPFFALAAVSCAITFLAQRSGGAVSPLARWSLGIRIANALVAYVRYLTGTLYPAGLAVFYPMPRAVPAAAATGAALFLAAACAAAVVLARRRAYVTTGWFWYLGMLVPVIGLVKVGGQAMADRYTYLPLIGIFLIASWGLRDLCGRGPRARAIFTGIAAVACLALAASARAQLAYWKDSETLYVRALEVTTDNGLAHYNLGCFEATQGREEEAATHFVEAIRIDPADAMTRANLGASWFRRGRPDEALRELSEAVRLQPGAAVTRASLGTVLIGMGRLEEALAQEKQAVHLAPDLALAHLNLGVVYAKMGRAEDAIHEYGEAVRLDPDSADARGNLGAALANHGRAAEALLQLAEAVRLRPGSASLRANLGNVLLMLGRPVQAAEEYREALRLAPGNPDVERNLARALAASAPPGG